MTAMSRNNSAGALQGFSICQPFLGAALQFYPALGTQQLDDLINAYLPGPASIKEKRATVSVDFFEYSQLTGETFKYYPVFTQSLGSATASSAESSPMQDSGYGSNFVSPVISDWSWSQSTPSSASASTPASVTQDAMPSKASKKGAAPTAKPQANDFSHLPGMKIMTKDGRDVTNSASRGCKTKEQRDHAHLMRIIKACEACRKKKVRCDPSHKKRTASQSQTATPPRTVKKAKTSSSQDSRPVTERSQQQNASIPTPSLFADPSFANFEIPDMSLELPESWESFVQFDDEPANAAPFDYDFFFDPEGHLSPQSSQSPATPSMVLSQPSGSTRPQALFESESFHEDAVVRPPTLPYLDATVPANNYVDFNLYSPEPSFLDEDSALVTDIGSSAGNEQGALSQRHHLAQGRQSLYPQEIERHASPSTPTDGLAVDRSVVSSRQLLEDGRAVDRGRRSLLDGGRLSTVPMVFGGIADLAPISGEHSVSRNDRNSRESSSGLVTGLSPAQTSRASLVTDRVPTSSPSQVPLPHVTPSSSSEISGEAVTAVAGLLQVQHALSASVSVARSIASRSQPSSSQAPSPTVTSPSRFSTSLEEQSYYAKTTVATRANSSRGATSNGATDAGTNSYLRVTSPRLAECRDTAAPLSSPSSVAEVFGLDGLRFVMATAASNGLASKRRSLVDKSSTSQLLCMVLLVVTFGLVATSLEVQALVGGFFQFALRLAIYKAYQSNSSLNDWRPQQSRLSTTPKPQGFSDGARLLSCVSTRLRHTRRQNQGAHYRPEPAVRPRILGFAQGFR